MQISNFLAILVAPREGSRDNLSESICILPVGSAVHGEPAKFRQFEWRYYSNRQRPRQ